MKIVMTVYIAVGQKYAMLEVQYVNRGTILALMMDSSVMAQRAAERQMVSVGAPVTPAHQVPNAMKQLTRAIP